MILEFKCLQVVFLKSCLHPDLLVLSPQWLCGPILGQLLSIDFVAHARVTGCYTGEDFQTAFPQTDALALLQVLETLQLCIQVIYHYHHILLEHFFTYYYSSGFSNYVIINLF